MPDVDLFLATHNRESVRRAHALHRELRREGKQTVEVEYGQLLGMADEVSLELLQAGGQKSLDKESGGGVIEEIPRVYKCLSWGTVGECVGYLMRRAVENRDAVGRTREGRVELGREVRRRVRGVFAFRR